eukprot:3932442-Rhodomonas_salina.1
MRSGTSRFNDADQRGEARRSRGVQELVAAPFHGNSPLASLAPRPPTAPPRIVGLLVPVGGCEPEGLGQREIARGHLL